MHHKSFFFTNSPLWRKKQHVFNQSLAPELASWIHETGSLTQRLRRDYNNPIMVKLLFHYWRKPFLNESLLLKLPTQQFCLIREVVLQDCNAQALILARTVLPPATIKIAQRNLSHLGTRPLGEVIFAYPYLMRLQSEITCIQSLQWRKDLLQQLPLEPSTWGRRTMYAIKHQPLLVSEFFLDKVL